jgi:hypothetical protein
LSRNLESRNLYKNALIAARVYNYKGTANMNHSKWFMPAMTIIILVTVLVGFWYLQSEIDSLRVEPVASPAPTPTSTPTFTPAPTPEPIPTTEPTLAYDYVVYEWHLKAEYINNVTWLEWNMASITQGDQIISTSYDSAKTWSENYIAYINSFWAIPQQIADSDIGVLAKAAFVRQVSVNASFNEATGYTKALYQYGEDDGVPWHYAIESVLPIIADGRGWTKTFI